MFCLLSFCYFYLIFLLERYFISRIMNLKLNNEVRGSISLLPAPPVSSIKVSAFTFLANRNVEAKNRGNLDSITNNSFNKQIKGDVLFSFTKEKI